MCSDAVSRVVVSSARRSLLLLSASAASPTTWCKRAICRGPVSRTARPTRLLPSTARNRRLCSRERRGTMGRAAAQRRARDTASVPKSCLADAIVGRIGGDRTAPRRSHRQRRGSPLRTTRGGGSSVAACRFRGRPACTMTLICGTATCRSASIETMSCTTARPASARRSTAARDSALGAARACTSVAVALMGSAVCPANGLPAPTASTAARRAERARPASVAAGRLIMVSTAQWAATLASSAPRGRASMSTSCPLG